MLDQLLTSPLLVCLSVALFFCTSITTFDKRLIQAKRAGSDVPQLPRWVGAIHMLDWILIIALLTINWRVGLTVWAVLFALQVLPVMETVGNLMMGLSIPQHRRVRLWAPGDAKAQSFSVPPASNDTDLYLEGLSSRRAASGGPQGYDVPFDPNEVEWFHSPGASAIRGHATGTSVSLIPRSRYSERHMWTVFGSTESGYFPADALVQVTAALPKTEMHRTFNATRKTCPTPESQYLFDNLPEGEYFLWAHVGVGGGAGAVMRAVRIAAGQEAIIDLLSHHDKPILLR